MKSANSLCWHSVTISEVKVGNYVSGLRSTTPRKISKVEINQDGSINLFEVGSEKELSYRSEATPNEIIDLLIDYETGQPVSDLSEYQITY